MKKQKRAETKPAAPKTASVQKSSSWWIWIAGLAALFVVFEVYGPALRGAFVLDDLYLPFADPNAASNTLISQLRLSRPLLMASFYLDYRLSGTDPYLYHVVNVLMHFAVSIVVMFIAARIMEFAGIETRMRQMLAVFSGALFLLHPLQTESVAYVASRSETMSVLFYYAAFALFLYTPLDEKSGGSAILRAVAIVLLFGAAVETKQHTLTLPALLLLTDLFWNRGGLKKNALIYGLLVLACAVGAALVWKDLAGADTAGFNVKDLTPAMYFFTQCRVIWTYVRMFFLPFGQNVDPDIPVSNSLFDHGAVFGLIALIALIAAAWIYRKRCPLASFGIFTFLLLLTPTSSVVPIRDFLAERRLYLPFIGLIFVCLEFLRRIKFKEAAWACAAAILICCVLTYQRNEVWTTPVALWSDSVSKSPQKMRPRFQLAHAQYQEGKCAEAAGTYDITSRLDKPDYKLFNNWALALDCAGHKTEAAERVQQAIALNPRRPEPYILLAKLDAEQGKLDDAMDVLYKAEVLDPRVAEIYLNRAGVYEMRGDKAAAIREIQRGLQASPSSETLRDALKRLSR